ncbi:MAG: carbon dioxide concentrating mechanism protein CcmL [Planctomycetota bacterium]|nr:carbon dioxide concentrating mechanism protein CcmL [Planctomycetota bacterium]RLS41282.1 MAG: carbon dioxide concentrating mechanism protein CcmL [Planctomycetota bacterium]
MRVGKVLGTVTLSRVVPELVGIRWLVIGPCDLAAIEAANGLEHLEASGEDLVVADGVGAGVGQIIAFSEGGEAPMPYIPLKKPVDAYAGLLIDSLDG